MIPYYAGTDCHDLDQRTTTRSEPFAQSVAKTEKMIYCRGQWLTEFRSEYLFADDTFFTEAQYIKPK